MTEMITIKPDFRSEWYDNRKKKAREYRKKNNNKKEMQGEFTINPKWKLCFDGARYAR